MLQENSNRDDIKINLDQSCADTESSDDLFSGGETRKSLQSVAKSFSGYRSGSSTDLSETVQPEKPMLVYGNTAGFPSNDLKQLDVTKLGSSDNCKWTNLRSLCKSHMQL